MGQVALRTGVAFGGGIGVKARGDVRAPLRALHGVLALVDVGDGRGMADGVEREQLIERGRAMVPNQERALEMLLFLAAAEGVLRRHGVCAEVRVVGRKSRGKGGGSVASGGARKRLPHAGDDVAGCGAEAGEEGHDVLALQPCGICEGG